MTDTTNMTVSLVVMILAALLPRFGITLGNDTLTTVVQTVIVIGSGLYAYLKHKNLATAAKAQGVR